MQENIKKLIIAINTNYYNHKKRFSKKIFS